MYNESISSWMEEFTSQKGGKEEKMAVYMLSDLIIMCSCKNLLLLLNIETAACLVLAHII